MTDTNPIGLGVIGCGMFGRFCLRAYSQMPEVRIAATADRHLPAAQAAAAEFGAVATDDPQALIARDDVDLVYIATPPASHHALVLAAARARKHCLCEKPLALSVAQADEMLAAAAEHNVLAAVNLLLRYNEVSEAVGRIIASGALGRVLSGHLTNCATDTPIPAGHWFWDTSISGGIFVEHGVHFFDLYRSWLGGGAVVSAHAETREGTEQEDRVACLVRHEDGTLVRHYHGFDQPQMLDRTDHRLVCELGDIRVDGWIPLTVRVDAVVNDQTEPALREAFGEPWQPEVIGRYTGQAARPRSRGKERNLPRRIRVERTPHPDKLAAYADSARRLLADQIAAVRDPDHPRVVCEENGRAALVLAEAATRRAAAGA